jgi:two-component system sensor kinase FixL
LNQPLTSILGNTHAGLSFLRQGQADPVELRAILEDIDNGLPRRRHHRTHAHPAAPWRSRIQPVTYEQSLQDLLRLTRSDLIARGVSVTNLATAGLPLAMTDRVQFQQILINLIKNACDAMESNPPEDRKLTLTTFVEQNEMRIGVLDCGVGLPRDIESLFEPFHSTKGGGLGMGLSICRTLVTPLAGGRLWAERRAERGAAFYVALPNDCGHLMSR